MSARIRVVVADDHPVVRRGLRTFLELHDDLEVVGEAGCAREAIETAIATAADVLLTDLVMPNGGGDEVIARVREQLPGCRVLVLTSFEDDDKVFAAIAAGAAGYLLKDAGPQKLADAIRAVHRGEAVLSPPIADKLMRHAARTPGRVAHADLTPREHDVLREIAEGKTNRQIARELGVAEKTVKAHVSSILSKLHLADRTQAAVYAVRNGLAGPRHLS